MPTFGPRARWKAVAVTSTDPVEFARDYEEKLNALVSDGWNITGMMNRGDAVVITAQKPELPPAILHALAAMGDAQVRPPPTPAKEDRTVEEVTYSYKDGTSVQSMRCASLEEAVGYFEEHIAENGAILPISIVVMTVTSYEPADLALLRSLVR